MSLEKVTARTTELALKLEAAIQFDDDGDSTIPESFVKENLVEGVDLDLVGRVQDEEAAFGSGLLLALGNKAQAAMETDSKMSRATAVLPFGSNTLKAAIDRKVMTRNPQTGEEKEKKGAGQLKLESGSSAKRGDLKKVLLHVAENFANSSKI